MKTGSFRRGDENMQWGLRDLEGIARKGGTSMVSFLYVSLSYSATPPVGLRYGRLWSQGLEGTSVSTGCETRKLWKG